VTVGKTQKHGAAIEYNIYAHTRHICALHIRLYSCTAVHCMWLLYRIPHRMAHVSASLCAVYIDSAAQGLRSAPAVLETTLPDLSNTVRRDREPGRRVGVRTARALARADDIYGFRRDSLTNVEVYIWQKN